MADPFSYLVSLGSSRASLRRRSSLVFPVGRPCCSSSFNYSFLTVGQKLFFIESDIDVDMEVHIDVDMDVDIDVDVVTSCFVAVVVAGQDV